MHAQSGLRCQALLWDAVTSNPKLLPFQLELTLVFQRPGNGHKGRKSLQWLQQSSCGTEPHFSIRALSPSTALLGPAAAQPPTSPEPPSLLPGPSRAPALVSCTGQGTAGPLGLAREVWDLLGDGVSVVLPVLVPPPDLAHEERTGEMGTLQAAFSWPC